MKNVNHLKMFAWGLTISVSVLTFAVWFQGLDGRQITSYRLFPLLGLLAFGIMWAHYIIAAVRQYFNLDKNTLARYFESTSLAVLFLILLHPGLLIWQLWRDGFGLPPESVLDNYVSPRLSFVVSLGTLSLVAFLAYELRRWFSKRTWWSWVQYASDLAMLAILYHGWRLGTHLQDGWFRAVWIFYTISLLGALAYSYWRRSQGSKT